MAHRRKQCITLFLTTLCSSKCEYCYLQNFSLAPASIDPQFAKRGIEDYFLTSDSRHVRYFAAGEPTCAFDTLVELHAFVQKIGGGLAKHEIQTSGVFSEAIADWLATHIQIIWISCDGPPDIQDSQRPIRGGMPSSPIIERNLKLMRRTAADNSVGIRATITPSTVRRQVEMLDYFSTFGVKAVYSDPVFPPVFSENKSVAEVPDNQPFLMEYAREFLRAQQRAKELGMFYGSILTVNFDEQTDTFCRACQPCPHLTPDGCVTCCDMAFTSSSLPHLVYGRYNRSTGAIDYDSGAINRIRQRRAGNLIECQGCEILYHCAGACFGEGVNETQRYLGVKKDYCEATRFLARHMPLDAGVYPYLHP